MQGYGAHVWAMRYRGMGHMGNGIQGYGAHRQWGTGAMGHIGNGTQSAMGTWATGHMEQ